ncbi:MAG: polyphosphate kinase 2 family protein, partial [Myxococcota bacterium]
MFEAVDSPYLVPFDGRFALSKCSTRPPNDAGDKDAQRERLSRHIEDLTALQRRLYAQDRWSVLLVFQAMDAAGKDSTIRAVMSGINPAGCQVFSFKKPSAEERDHDFLWRTTI